jgi:hypothetical protein
MPNPRSLPIAIDPRSFNMTASSGNCDANNPRRQVSPGEWHPPCSTEWQPRSVATPVADRHLTDPTGTSCPRSSCTTVAQAA